MSEIRVQLPEVPYWPNDLIHEDSALLDQLARDFAQVRGGEQASAAQFLYGELPIIAFDQIFDNPLDKLLTGSLLWMFHLSGYLGGVWLRAEIERAGKTQRLAGVALPPTQEAFDQSVARARQGLDAAAASGASVLAHNRSCLLPSGNPVGLTDGLVESFGYNQGYLLEILESPPEGLATPAGYGITAKGPLACSYQTQRLGVLARLAPVEIALAARSTSAYAELASQITPVQRAPRVERTQRRAS